MTGTILAAAPSSQPRAKGIARRLISSPRGALSILFILVLVVVTVGAPWIAPYSPIAQTPDLLLPAGSAGHVLGTDDLGRDVLSRLIFGTRTSVGATFLAVGVALAIGLPLGIVAGYFGGWVDSALMRVVDAILSFPAIILALSITAVLGAGLQNSMLAIGIVFSPAIARLIRGQMLALKSETFMDAATSFGSSGLHRVFRHFLPNTIQPVLVQASLLLAAALIAEASLSFLGLGVQPPDPSWGSMLARAYMFIGQAPLQMLAPGIAIAASALAFNVLGDVIQTELDPKRSSR